MDDTKEILSKRTCPVHTGNKYSRRMVLTKELKLIDLSHKSCVVVTVVKDRNGKRIIIEK